MLFHTPASSLTQGLCTCSSICQAALPTHQLASHLIQSLLLHRFLKETFLIPSAVGPTSSALSHPLFHFLCYTNHHPQTYGTVLFIPGLPPSTLLSTVISQGRIVLPGLASCVHPAPHQLLGRGGNSLIDCDQMGEHPPPPFRPDFSREPFVQH